MLFALLYLQFALWWLDLNLLSGPDALQKVAAETEYYVICFQ